MISLGFDAFIAGFGVIGISAVAAGLLRGSDKNEYVPQKQGDWILLTGRAEIGKYLPYEDFLEQEKIYITSDGGVGIILEADPIVFAGGKQFESFLASIEGLPDGANIGFMLYPSPDVSNIISAWQSGIKLNDDFSKNIVSNYAAMLESKQLENISLNFEAPIRNMRFVVSVKMGGKSEKIGLFSQGKKLVDDPRLRFKRNIQKMVDVRNKLVSTLKAGGIYSEVVTPNGGLISLMNSILHQKHDPKDAALWDGSSLKNALIPYDAKIEIHEDYIVSDGVYGKSLSAKNYPEYFSLQQTMRYMGNIFTNDNISEPFIFSLNITKYSDPEKDELKRTAALVMNQQLPYGMFPRLKLKHEDLGYGIEKLEKGKNLYFASVNLFAFAPTLERLTSVTSHIQTYYKDLDFKFEADKYIHFASLCSMLPLGYDQEMQDFLGSDRGRAVFGENCADLVPACADWKGNGFAVPLISPRGQFYGIDLFRNKTGGYNGFAIGQTGSGKSVSLQWLTLNYLLRGDRIWIIDIGESYAKYCHVFGGQYIDLDINKPLCINPFSLIEKDNIKEYNDDRDFIADLYLLMGLPRNAEMAEEQEKLIKSYLIDAIDKSYTDNGTDSCVDTVMEELKKLNVDGDQRLKDFIQTLKMYSSSGPYGAFFNGPAEITFNSKLTVLENKRIEDRPDLRDPVLMVLTYHISKQIYLGKKDHHDQHDIVVIDEAHKFLGQSVHIDLFIEQAYRRFRKDGASVILGSQGFEDFYGAETISKAGRVIVQNSYWKFFLKQGGASLEIIKKANYFGFGDYENRLLESIAPNPDGEYGELVIYTDDVIVKSRIVLDHYLKTMMFTDSRLRSKLKQLTEDEGYTMYEAIELLQKEH